MTLKARQGPAVAVLAMVMTALAGAVGVGEATVKRSRPSDGSTAIWGERKV